MMRIRIVRRAVAVAALATLVATSLTNADTVPADADGIATGMPGEVPLGTVAPGAVLTVEVRFSLVCSGFSHVDAGQRVDLLPGATTVPDGGAISVGGATILPPGEAWPDDGEDCSSNPEAIPATGTADVVLTAPPTDGDNLPYTASWSRQLTPSGFLDSGAITSMTTITFRIDVVSNTAPTLTLPTDFTAEGDTSGGWTADWSIGAEDSEDEPDPVPACSHGLGDVLPLGVTTVSCSVEDAGGLTAGGSFTVTVVDTVAPALSGVPSRIDLATSEAGGAPLAYALPHASDVVDPAPSVSCAPAPGEVAPVGESAVTCTARDASGNESSASFPVHVSLWSVTWDEPVSAGSPGLTANVGRSVPLKLRIWSGGSDVRAGAVEAVLARCDTDGPLAAVPLSWSDGAARWTGKVDTAGLSNGCHRVAVVVGGAAVGGFELWLTGGPSSAKLSGAHRR